MMHDDLHTTPRLYTKEALNKNSLLTLGDNAKHYLANVLRLAPPAPLRVFNGSDGEWHASIHSINKKNIILHLHECLREQNSEPDIILYCAPIKRAYFDYMVMKATELGVRKIQPILTVRTQVRELNVERMHSIAIEAAEQSERLTVPDFLPPISLARLVSEWPAQRLPLVCAEFGEAAPIQKVLSSLPSDKAACAGLMTGPEGGFLPEEIEALKKLPNAQALRLGPRILRADTAAIAALACWQAVCGDWQNQQIS